MREQHTIQQLCSRLSFVVRASSVKEIEDILGIISMYVSFIPPLYKNDMAISAKVPKRSSILL